MFLVSLLIMSLPISSSGKSTESQQQQQQQQQQTLILTLSPMDQFLGQQIIDNGPPELNYTLDTVSTATNITQTLATYDLTQFSIFCFFKKVFLTFLD